MLTDEKKLPGQKENYGEILKNAPYQKRMSVTYQHLSMCVSDSTYTELDYRSIKWAMKKINTEEKIFSKSRFLLAGN